MHARPAQYGRRKLASAPTPELSVAKVQVVAEETDFSGLRRLFWLYFWLLLLEGALRKWFLPGLADPLLVVRDPVVLLIYLLALSRGILPFNGYVITCILLGVISIITCFASGHGNFLVMLYGLRTNFLHIPLIFILAKVLNRQDVEKFGTWFLITAIPMAVIALIQFRSPQGAWINYGVGAAEGAQLTVGFDKIRPPGTFSFTNGLSLFTSVVAAFLLSFQLSKWKLSRHLVLGAVFSLLAMIAVSGSRTTMVAVIIITAAMAYACFRNGAFFAAGVRTVALLAVVCFLMFFRHEFRQGIEIQQNRIETGGGVEHGMVVRTVVGFTEPFTQLSDVPIFGKGIGIGTTAAGGLLHGERRFLVSEGEWGRVLHESGPILGVIYLGMRVLLAIGLFVRANRSLQDDNPIPLLLAAAIGPAVLSGQFGVPTILGFAVFGAGLCLAATNGVRTAPSLEPIEVPAAPRRPGTVPGRSTYAEKLHGR